MDFITDSSVRNNAFLNKTKNQAKKLFKLAKQNQLKIEINNLSHAQEILAQINGFPNWHALESTISNTLINNKVSFNEQFNKEVNNDLNNNLVFETVNNIPFIRSENNEFVTSFISIDNFPLSYLEFNVFVNKAIMDCSFQYNMGFNKVNIFIKQEFIEKINNNCAISLKYNDYLGLTKEEFESLFNFNINFTKEESFKIKFLMKIETKVEMFDQHISFCQTFNNKNLLDNFLLKSNLSYDEYNIIYNNFKNYQQFITQDKSSDFSLSPFILKNKVMARIEDFLNHNRWILALEALSKRKHNWQINISLNSETDENTFNMFHSENLEENNKDINNKYLMGLYSSLIKTNISSSESKEFHSIPTTSKNLPWTNGTPLIDYVNKNIEYYQLNSNLQKGNTIVYGTPGSGVSLFMDMMNVNNVLNSKTLPHIGIIDVGSSTKSFLSLLKNILPKKDHHLIQSYKIEMNKDFSVNPFDTQLGCRFPNEKEKEILNSFLLMLSSQNDGMYTAINSIIEEVYEKYSVKENQKIYKKNINKEVDNCINKLNLLINENTTWWDVVDLLFEENKINEAKLAQNYAVPILSDCMSLIYSDNFTLLWGKVMCRNNDSLVNELTNSFTNIIDKYNFLNQPTIFNPTNAKIVVLDLDEVIRLGNKNSQYENSMVSFFTYNILNKIFYLNNENTKNVITLSKNLYKINLKEKYYKYHEEKSKNKQNTSLCFSELHRYFNETMKYHLISDMKNSRKLNCSIFLSSQDIENFKDLGEFSSNIFVLGDYNVNYQKRVAQIFKLNFNEESYLKYINHSEKVIFTKFKTIDQNYSKLVSIVYNPLLITALSTQTENVKLINMLSDKIGYLNAIKCINKYYPSGINGLINTKNNDTDNLYKELVKDIIRKENLL